MRPPWDRLYWIALVLSLLVSEAAVAILWRSTSVEDKVLGRDLNDLALVNELAIETERSEARGRSYLQTGDLSELADFENATQQTESQVEELYSVVPEEERPLVASVERARSDALAAARTPIAMRSRGEPQVAVDEATRAVLPLRQSLNDRLEQLRQTVRLRFVRRLVSAQEGVSRAFVLVAGAVLVGSGLLAAGLLLLRRTLAGMEQQRRALAEQAAFLNQVMGIVSHDLRSPLTAVIATAEVGLAEEVDRRSRARSRRVLRAARRMERVSGLLIDSARLSGHPGLLLLPDRIDVLALCEDVLGDYRDRHAGANLEVIWSGRHRFTIDEDRLAGTLDAMLDELLRDDPAAPMRIEGSVDGGGLSIRIARSGAARGAVVQPGPVRVGEDLELLVADRAVAGQGGRIERRHGEIGLHVPWNGGAPPPAMDAPPVH